MTDPDDTATRPTRACREPFPGAPAVAAGSTSRDRLRGPDFARVGPNLYLGAATEVDVRVRLLTLGAWARGRGVVAGPPAALAFGAECPWEDAEIVVDGHRRLTAIPDVRVRSDRLRDDEVAEELRPLVVRHPHVRGIVQAREVLRLMDGRAQSPMESRMRLRFTLPDLLAPVPQHRVYLPDGRWKDLDLAWPRVPPGRGGLGLEYDGDEHRTITGQNRDAIRDGELDDLAWETIRVTAVMVDDEQAAARLLARVRRRLDAGSSSGDAGAVGGGAGPRDAR